MSLFTRFGRPPAQDRATAAGDNLTADGPPERRPDGAAADAIAGVDATAVDATAVDAAGVAVAVADDDDIAGAGADAGARGEDAAGSRRQRVVARVRSVLKHPVVAGAITVLAALFVLLPLTAPDNVGHRTLAIFVRLPLEGLIAFAILLALPARARRVGATIAGVALGLLAVVKILDIGFDFFLNRPFDLVLDWGLFSSAVGVLTDSIGRVGGIGAVIGILLLVAAGIVLTTLSALRLTRLAARHNTAAIRIIAALAVVWVACAGFGVQFVPGVPVADKNAAALVHDRALQVRNGLHDKQAFLAESAVDPFRNTPGSQLLTGLRGKDVIVSFVESYGRSAIEDPTYSTQINPLLDAGTRRLAAAGFAAKSGFLTSSTAGGGSWLAHSTLFSGLWINNQQRYRTLVASDRLTLPNAFHRAGWRTVSLEPAISDVWPERKFYGYDRGYEAQDLGYRGPRFSYAAMPDQYTYATLQRTERAPGHAPLMAEITLVSSHVPWTPIPKFIDWSEVGDGSVYNDPANQEGASPSVVWKSPSRVRTAYTKSIEYTLISLISYVEKYGDKNLVFVFLGDHQPFSVIAGDSGNRDVPVTVVAKDPAVLKRISDWGWTDGLRPAPQAPVWRMDAFRNRFLTAFGPGGSAH